MTKSIVLPALRAHLHRRDDAELEAIVASAERRILDLVLEGKPGLPIRYWVCGSDVRGQVRLRRVPEGYMLLEGLSPPLLARALDRTAVMRALLEVPAKRDPDLATSFSIAARCAWVLR